MNYKFMWAEENYNYYEFEHILLNYGVKSKKRWGCGITNGLIYGRDFHAEFYLPDKELKKEAECWHAFLTSPERFNALLDNIAVASKDIMIEIKKLIHADLSKLTNIELWEHYDLYSMKLGILFNCYIASQPHRITKLEEELFRFLEEKKASDPVHYFITLTIPKKTFVFSSLGNMLLGKSFAELLKKEECAIDKGLINKRMYAEKDVDQAEKNKMIKELNPPENIRHITEVLGALAYERFKMRFVWMPALYYNELFLIEFKRRYNITKRELRAYEDIDIENLVKFGKRIEAGIIAKRKEGFLKILRNGKLFSYEGADAQKMIDKLVYKQKEKKKIKEVKGMTACKGYAMGRVAVFSYRKSADHSAKIKKMQQGDVIVTEMTRPNIILACTKAGAILTDEGGILCHAAIVSREMNKPCIIGTNIATSVFKDGDYVEVDANKGIARKISLNEYMQKKRKLKLGYA